MLQCLDHKERSLEPSEPKITDNFDCMIAVQDGLELLITIYWIDLKRKRKITVSHKLQSLIHFEVIAPTFIEFFTRDSWQEEVILLN